MVICLIHLRLPLSSSEYKSPEYETLSYSMIVRRLVTVGYPKVGVCAAAPDRARALASSVCCSILPSLPKGHREHRIQRRLSSQVSGPPPNTSLVSCRGLSATPTSCRGLLFDKIYGNLIKVDGFGNILEVFHGFSCLSM